MSDIEGLGFSKKSSITSAWLTTLDQPYIWESKKNNTIVVNKPINIFDPAYQAILGVLNQINADYNLELNSCLLTWIPNGSSNIRLHADNEDDMDSTSPIVVVPIGSTRKVEFLHCYQACTEKALLTLEPVSGSLYQMLPGCQEYFLHRVPAMKHISGGRYALSFRKMIPSNVNVSGVKIPLPAMFPPPLPPPPSVPESSKADHTTSPIKELISLFEPPLALTPPSTPAQVTPSPALPSPTASKRRRRTTVLFGTSMTLGVDGDRLAYGGRKCINISESGAKIEDISRMLDNFYHTNPNVNNVDKIIYSFGTNDIKFLKFGLHKLKRPIKEIIYKTKEYFPRASIFFQSVLPMKISSNIHINTAKNFEGFNRILVEVCREERCSYIDCFFDFVRGYDYNSNLYKDNLHLNKRGIGILCRWLKHTINRGTFNPYVH